MDALTDERDDLQIKLAEATANATAATRRFTALKTRYQSLSDEFTQLQNDLERERQQKADRISEAELSASKLNEFKGKYREETSRATAAEHQRDEAISNLSDAKAEIERKSSQIESLTREFKAQLEKVQAEQKAQLSEAGASPRISTSLSSPFSWF